MTRKRSEAEKFDVVVRRLLSVSHEEIQKRDKTKRHRMARYGMEFDEDQLRRLIQRMTPRSRVFRVIREELTKLGRWKNKPRGKPGFKKGGDEMATTLSHHLGWVITPKRNP